MTTIIDAIDNAFKRIIVESAVEELNAVKYKMPTKVYNLMGHFEKNGELFLKITLVSYERIADLHEVYVKIDGDLEKRIRTASSEYSPPLFRVYKDDKDRKSTRLNFSHLGRSYAVVCL